MSGTEGMNPEDGEEWKKSDPPHRIFLVRSPNTLGKWRAYDATGIESYGYTPDEAVGHVRQVQVQRYNAGDARYQDLPD